MANRNDPDVRQHETLPGLCPAPGRSLSLPHGARPVEQMVDAAIERIAVERDAIERDAIERSTIGGAIERVAQHEHELAHYDYDRGQPPSSQATRLRWKGLDVSEEFRDYAERIARGEDLPPFEGRVLAEPNAAFPWGSLSRNEPPAILPGRPAGRPGRGGQLALWTSAAVVVALLGWSVALKVRAIDPPSALMNVTETSAEAALAVESRAAEALAAESLAAEPLAAKAQPSSAPALAVPASAVPEAPVSSAGDTLAAPVGEPQASALAVAPAPVAPTAPTLPAVSSAGVPAAVAVSIAPPVAEPLAAVALAPAAIAPAAPAPAALTPALAAPTAAPAPAAKPTSRPDPDLDFGIDELPLPSGSGSVAKGQVSETGNIGDLARVGQSGGGAARKEPGSESSAKGSLLVEKPSF